jgi:hypothetical protein
MTQSKEDLDKKIRAITQSKWDVNTPYLVLVGYYDFDVSWVNRLKLPRVIYFKDMPDKAPYTARNKAKGETNVLKFIVDFYDALPQNLICVHQYEFKWYHRGSLVEMLNRSFKLESLYKRSSTPGYVSLNNRPVAIQASLGENATIMKNSGWWDATMLPYFGTLEGCGDFVKGKRGCSQFIVSRERIRSLPREFYRNMYDWLVENVVDEPHSSFNPKNFRRLKTSGFTHPRSNYHTSRYLEWTWELIFTAYKDREFPRLSRLYRISTKLVPNTRSGTRNILVLYGAGGFFRDVTQVFLNVWFPTGIRLASTATDSEQHWELLCPPGITLTSILGDHIIGTVKMLKIMYADKTYEQDQLSTAPLVIPL